MEVRVEEWNLVKTEEMVTETAEVECLTPLVGQEIEEERNARTLG